MRKRALFFSFPILLFQLAMFPAAAELFPGDTMIRQSSEEEIEAGPEEPVEIPKEERYDQEPPKTEKETEETEWVFVPETVEIGNKIRVETPEGYSFVNEDLCSCNTCSLASDTCTVSVYCIENSSVSHEVENEIKSRRKRIKRIIKDEVIEVGTHPGRYLETHVVRPDYECCIYIGLTEMHEQTVKFNVITKYYDESIEDEVKRVMENTCYTYWL